MTLQEFANKYDLGIDVNQMHALERKMSRVNNFLFEDKVLHYDKNSYIKGLKYMLALYMEKQTNPKNIENISAFKNFNLAQFVIDYENAKQNEFRESGDERNRKPYEGVESKAFSLAFAVAKSYSKSLPDIWAARIKKGANLDELRDVTVKQKKKNQNANIASLIAYLAMEKVIADRTIAWRLNPLNWRRWYRENKLMDDLTTKARALAGRDIDLTHQVLYSDCTEPLFDKDKLEDFKRDFQRARIANDFDTLKENEFGIAPDASLPESLLFSENDLVSGDKNIHGLDGEKLDFSFGDMPKEVQKSFGRIKVTKKPESMRDVRSLASNNKLASDVKAEFVDILEKANDKNSDKTYAARQIYQEMLIGINNLWLTPENMSEHAINMFKNVYRKINTGIREMSVKDKIVAAQKIADVILNVYTPIASRQELAQYGNNFAMKNLKRTDIIELTNCDENADELLNDAKLELGIVKESVPDLNEEFNENIIVEPVQVKENDSLTQIKAK